MNASARSEGKSSEREKEPADAVGGVEYPPPLKPRPRLLIVLSIIFVFWVAGLLAMYFKTVYPFRHDPAHNAREVDK